MRFSIAAVLAFATTGLCQVAGYNVITKPTTGEKVPAGSTYEIVWQPSADQPGDITIGLLGGSSPSTLAIVDTIATGVDPSTGSYSWDVPSRLGDMATYGIMITLESDEDVFQYGFPFQIVGGGDDSDDEDDSTTTTTTAPPPTDESTTETSTATTGTDEDSTSISVPTSTIVSSTVTGNLSTGSPQTTITSVVVDQPSSTTTSTSTLVTNAAGSIAAGSFAMLGGVAMAVLAL